MIDPEASCENCSLWEEHGHDLAVVAILRHDNRNIGILGVSFPREMKVDDEERSLLAEVSSDIAFALHDIETERQRARYAQIVDASTEAMVLIDRNYVILEANQSYLNISNWTEGKIGGHKVPRCDR